MHNSYLEKFLLEHVDAMASMNHPALLERFILRNGEPLSGQARPEGIAKRKNKECFYNSTHVSIEKNLDYCEGFAIRLDIGIPVLHAWNMQDRKIIDSTWEEPEKCEYFGVKIPNKLMWEQLEKNGVYGILDTGMINHKFLFELDPDLEKIFNDIRKI